MFIRLAAILIAVAGCSADGAGEADVEMSVVRVAAQPCPSPNRALGLGVVVDDGVVVTAAHTVDGDLRSLTVDGAPGTVLSVDPRTDLALLATETNDRAPAELADATGSTATVIGPDGDLEVAILSTGPLIVRDVTDGTRHRREVHRFTPGVTVGTSGAPLLDGDGRLLGIVVLDGSSGAYAVTAAELAAVLARPSAPTSPAPGDCPG